MPTLSQGFDQIQSRTSEEHFYSEHSRSRAGSPECSCGTVTSLFPPPTIAERIIRLDRERTRGASSSMFQSITLRSRRSLNRLTLLTIVALAAIASGCGPQETIEPDTNIEIGSQSASDRQNFQTRRSYVEYSDGRVTIRSDGSLQLAILERLADQVGFEIVAGRTTARPISLQIERVSVIDAIAAILDGSPYTLGYDRDDASGSRVLARVEIGETLEEAAVNAVRTMPTNARGLRDRVASTSAQGEPRIRRNPIDPADEVYVAEQAEFFSSLDSPDPEARSDAADWIDLEGEAFERILSLLETDPDPDVRLTIVERLGDDGSPAAIDALVDALRDPNPEVVLLVMDVLELEAEHRLISELNALLSHSDPEVREAAQDIKDFQ